MSKGSIESEGQEIILPEEARRYERVENVPRLLCFVRHMVRKGTLVTIGRATTMYYDDKPCLVVPIIEKSQVTGYMMVREVPTLRVMTFYL